MLHCSPLDQMNAKSHSNSGILLNLETIHLVIKAPTIFLLRFLLSPQMPFSTRYWCRGSVCGGPVLCYPALPFRLEHPAFLRSEVADGSRLSPFLGMALWEDFVQEPSVCSGWSLRNVIQNSFERPSKLWEGQFLGAAGLCDHCVRVQVSSAQPCNLHFLRGAVPGKSSPQETACRSISISESVFSDSNLRRV